jgi:hypothetical protein
MLFVEKVWITHVYEQGFKILSIHSKFILPEWATISFPFINQNRVCFKIVKVFFGTMYLWQAPTNQKEKMKLISICCSPYVNSKIFNADYLNLNILLKHKGLAMKYKGFVKR